MDAFKTSTKGLMSDRRTASNPPDVAPPIRAYYSNCVKIRSMTSLYIAGQLGVDLSGKLVGPGVAEQAEQALENISRILAANGATMRHVVKVTVYVTNIDELDDIAPARLKHFPKDGPASVIVEISRLAVPGAKVEIEATAALEE
jgi:2-iminobutanoate/2-iminopropanoate deaminase